MSLLSFSSRVPPLPLQTVRLQSPLVWPASGCPSATGAVPQPPSTQVFIQHSPGAAGQSAGPEHCGSSPGGAPSASTLTSAALASDTLTSFAPASLEEPSCASIVRETSATLSLGASNVVSVATSAMATSGVVSLSGSASSM